MRTYKLILILILQFSQAFTQNQNNSEEKFDYEFKGHIKLKKLNSNQPILNDTTWIADKYRFNVVAEESAKNGSDEFDYVVLRLVNFKWKFEYQFRDDSYPVKILEMIRKVDQNANLEIENLKKRMIDSIGSMVKPSVNLFDELDMYNTRVEEVKDTFDSKIQLVKKNLLRHIDSVAWTSKKNIKSITFRKPYRFPLSKKKVDTIKYKKNYVDIDDQDKLFWLKKDRFDKYLTQGYIQKRYQIHPQVAYGASLSIPFKIRPETKDQNIKITPEISIGGYLGARMRLNRYKPIYLYLPVVTAGITTIGINSNNIIDESTTEPISSENTEDGLVFARTFSLGTFVEFNSFQIGFVTGWDRPGGEIAKDWIYNDRLWYSFSIGYNFLRRNDDK